MQRILAEVHGVSERQRRWPRRVRIVSVEAVAEKWLVPKLVTFKAAHPAVALELETNHRGVDPDRRDFDAWFAYTGETAAPRPVTSREDTLLEETLYKENPLPVCSPALLAARGQPDGPGDLDDGAPALGSEMGPTCGGITVARRQRPVTNAARHWRGDRRQAGHPRSRGRVGASVVSCIKRGLSALVAERLASTTNLVENLLG